MLLIAQAVDTDRILVSGHITWIVGLALSALAMAATWAMTQLGKKLKTQEEGTLKSLLLVQLSEFATSVVAHLNATLKAKYLEATRDGSLSSAEAQKIAGAALEELKRVLGTEGVERLKKVFGWADPEVNIQLRGILERKVLETKALAAIPAASPPPLSAPTLGIGAPLPPR